VTFLGILTILHIVGAALGVGAAAASDSVFLSAIRNRRVSPDQYVLIRATSHVVMGGLTLLVLSGIPLALDDHDRWLQGYFLVKMTAVLILMLNGFVFHLAILPFLGKHLHGVLTEDVLAPRLWLFACTGALSGVSWFTALLLALVAPAGASFAVLLGLYLAAVAAGAATGYLLLAQLLFRKAPEDVARVETGDKGETGSLILLGVLVVLFLGTIVYVVLQR